MPATPFPAHFRASFYVDRELIQTVEGRAVDSHAVEHLEDCHRRANVVVIEYAPPERASVRRLLAACGLAAMLAGCGGSGDAPSAPQNVPAAITAPVSQPTPNTPSAPPVESAPVLTAGWLTAWQPSHALSDDSGICLQRAQRVLCAQPGDSLPYAYSGFMRADRAPHAWTGIALTGERWQYIVKNGQLTGERTSLGDYADVPNIGVTGDPTVNPLELRVTSATGSGLTDVTTIRGYRFTPSPVSLAGVYSVARRDDAIATSLVIEDSGAISGQGADGCTIAGTVSPVIGVAAVTLSTCKGNYSGLAALAPRSTDSTGFTDWSDTRLVLVSDGTAGRLVIIAGASLPNVPNYSAPLPPAPPSDPAPTPPSDPVPPSEPNPPPVIAVSLTADNTEIAPGGSTVIRWDAPLATRCTASSIDTAFNGDLSTTSGSVSTSALTVSRDYQITCYRQLEARVSASVRVEVIDDSPTCEATNSCDPPPLQIGFAGVWLVDGYYCEFRNVAPPSFYCTTQIGGTRYIWEGIFTDETHAVNTPGCPSFAAVVDASNYPIRINVTVNEFQISNARPSGEWPAAPRCAP